MNTWFPKRLLVQIATGMVALCLAFSSKASDQNPEYSIIRLITKSGLVEFKVRTGLLEYRDAISNHVIIRCSYPGFSPMKSWSEPHIRIVIKEASGKTGAEVLAEADHTRPGRGVERFVGERNGFEVYEYMASKASNEKTTVYLKSIDGDLVMFSDDPYPSRTIGVTRRFKSKFVVNYQVDKKFGKDLLVLDRSVMHFLNNLTN